MAIENNDGTILVRVSIIMMLLLAGALGLAPFMIISIDSKSLAHEVTEANNLAQDKIEELRASQVCTATPYYRCEPEVKNKYCIISKVDTGQSDPSLPDNMYSINVNVSWLDHSKLRRSINCRTLTARSISR